MNIFKKSYIRTYQKTMYLASFFIKFDEPKIIKGEESFDILINLIERKGCKNTLVVTDKGIHSINLEKELLETFKRHNQKYVLYSEIEANPTIDQIETGVNIYLDNNCDNIVSFGGGSAMDAAKIIGARVANPNIPINKLKGIMKVKKPLPFMAAIPTTAGTGSETTIAAVVSNHETNEKFPIEDSKLVPKVAVLNPSLLTNLPSNVTSTTGMDTLTHAIEAYIGKSNTKKTKRFAKEAILLVYHHLLESYNNPNDLVHREKMQIAAYDAGVAFTRAYVGYVHAIAHTLGGFYNIPHGLANAVILPYVLEEFGESIYNQLAELYDLVFTNRRVYKKSDKAALFINSIIQMNEKMNIPNNFNDIINVDDINEMVEHAYKEAIPLYPTPVLWNKETFAKIFYKLVTKQEEKKTEEQSL